MSSPVGLLGAGLLGTALARRLLAAGFAVVGFDLSPERRQALADLGAAVAESALEVAERCGRLVFSLPDSAAVEAVVAGLAEHLAPGSLILDTTTGDPERTAALAALLAGRGVTYLDATVVGSSAVVEEGEGIFLVGGPAEGVGRAADLLGALAKGWFHLGPAGSGAVMKLVVNLVLGLNRAALAEGLALARACGLDPQKTLEVLQAGAAYSRVMDAKGPKMVARDFAPQARLRQHLKDVHLILDLARRHGAPAPFSALHRELLDALIRAGFGDEDNSAILRAFDPPACP